MRLNRIELYGFKSFADRVQLDLTAGLTAVVGPNGCGKSNIIDAIKWTLGEQRPSALRGDEMMDVVFKGNGARPARNFAEVSLVFDNTDGALAVEYGEVVITRRLFRSGESEYLLNRNNVRLKDIRNLLLDTGLGTSAYSIMEQGRIDAVLSANPTERRQIFEEAAGISRYRSQRKECENKLERTEQNLLRLGDVIDELEKRVRSLKNQAGRARSYLAARDRVAELKSLFYAHRWKELGQEIVQLEERAGGLVGTERQVREQLDGARREWSAVQEQGSLRHHEVEEAAEAFRQTTVQVEALSGRVSAARERIREAGARRVRVAAVVREIEEGLEDRRGEQAGVERRLAEVRAGLKSAEQAEQAARHELAGAEAALARWTAEAQTRRAAALEQVGALTAFRNTLAAASSRREELEASRDRLAARVAALRGKLDDHTSLQGDLAHGSKGLEARHERAAAAVNEQRERRQTLLASLAATDDELIALREKLAAVESRREALEELIQRREGVAAGAVLLLETGLTGIEGLVVEQLRAPARLARALEAALGNASEAVVVATRNDALAALALLHEQDGGRVQLLARDTLRPREGAPGGDPLLAHVQVLSRGDVAEALLGHVRLVPDRDALRTCRVDGVTVFVTADGDLLDERGVLRGGKAGKEGGLVARQAECDDLDEEAAGLRQDVAATTARRADLCQAREAADEQIAAAEAELHAADRDRGHARARGEQMAQQAVSLQRDLALDENDLGRLQQELDERAAEVREVARRERAVADQVDADRVAEERADTMREELERNVDACRAALSERQVQLTALGERAEALASEVGHVRRSLDERTAEADRGREEIAELEREEAERAAELERLAERDGELAEERDRSAGRLAQARQLTEELETRLQEFGQRVTACEKELGVASQALAAGQMELQEARIRRESLHARLIEELGVDFERQPPPEEDDGQTDWTAVEQEIEQLRGRMERAGTVNLAAVSELEEVSERLAFLTGQRDDLVAARKAIHDTVTAINRESRERFVKTFEEVRGHFRGIFRKLFRGGKADIKLQEGEDVLEAGVEIVAAPPGKDPRSISLLSGGERTLTAVGLLFALFRTRPSPVCLLDEVDAALDELNIDRFCSVLEDFLDGSQFLVVTHARRTMSYADTLYGITMQEHGVSTALSLSVPEYLKSNGHHRVAAPSNGRPGAKRDGDDPAPGGVLDRVAERAVEPGPVDRAARLARAVPTPSARLASETPPA